MLVRSMTLSAVLVLAACGQGGKPSANPQPAAEAGNKVVGLNRVEGEIKGKIAPGSKFSRLQIGMFSNQVESAIGQPDNMTSHITGKQFIPFYFGGDMSRVETFYRGEGQLTYSHPSLGNSTLVLIGIRGDRTESGVAR